MHHQNDGDEINQVKDRLKPYLLQHIPSDTSTSTTNTATNSSLLPKELSHVPHDILTKGYAIIPSILSPSECELGLDLLWDFVQDTSGNLVQRHDCNSWYPFNQLVSHSTNTHNSTSRHDSSSSSNCHMDENKNTTTTTTTMEELMMNDPWPYTGYSTFPDMFQSQGAGFLLGPIRQLVSQRIFEPLFQTRELHASKEGFTFARPTLVLPTTTSAGTTAEKKRWKKSDLYTSIKVCSQIQGNSSLGGDYSAPNTSSCSENNDGNSSTHDGNHEEFLGYHYDQSHHLFGLHTIQCSIAFIDQNEETKDGHFVCYPHSHSDVHQSITQNTYRGQFPWVPLTKEEIQQQVEGHNNLQPVHIYVKAGDAILWRSDLIHASCPPSVLSSQFRAVGYFSFSPASWSYSNNASENNNKNNPSLLTDKLNAYRWGKTGDHRAFVESWHSHKRVSKKTKKKTKNQIPHSNDKYEQGNTNDDTTSTHYELHRIVDRQRPYYRLGPAKITKRLAELYGLLPYGIQTQQEMEGEIQKAIIRGVRFVSDCSGKDEDHFGDESMKQSLVIKSEKARLEPLVNASLQIIQVGKDRQPLLGQDKYLGGMCSPCGRYVYGIPGSAQRVLRIDTTTNEMDFIGSEYTGKFKWLRGVEVPPSMMMEEDGVNEEYPFGCCIALPSNAKCVLKINPANNEVSTFGDIDENAGWLYHGGNLASDGFIYAIPANATRVLKINPRTDKIEYIGPTFIGQQKWYGGIIGIDGCIYGVPHNASSVLKIDPKTQLCTVIGEEDIDNDLADNHHKLSKGNWKWHGGLSIQGGRKIVCFPNNADNILIIDVENQSVFLIGDATILKTGRHRIPSDGRYKYLGGAVSIDGRFTYLFPCDAERVLRIDNYSFDLKLVGPELLEGENKFQNGFVSKKDGCLYGIPQRSSGVLRIMPKAVKEHVLQQHNNIQDNVEYMNDAVEDSVDVLYCGDEMIGTKDKFEGGVMDKQGNIYCIPLRAKALVKVIPGNDLGL